MADAKRLRFAAGLAIGLVPSAGLAVTAVALGWRGRRRTRGTATPDPAPRPGAAAAVPWTAALLGAALLTLPALAQGRLAAELLAPWLAVAVFVTARRVAARSGGPGAIGSPAFVAGAASAVVALAALPLAAVATGREPWLAGWTAHPNLWAAKVVTLAIAVLLLNGRMRVAAPVVAAAAVACLATGSRAALVGLAAGLVLVAARRLAGDARRRPGAVRGAVATLGLLAVMGLAAVAGPWRSHLLSALPTPEPPEASLNLVPASEAIGASPWRALGVRVEDAGTRDDGAAIARVVKTERRADARAAAPVALQAGVEYRLTFDLAATPGGRPGVHGWTAPESGAASEAQPDPGPAATLSVVLEDRTARVATRGPLSAEVERTEPAADGWTRVVARFRLDGEGARVMRLGPAPDLRDADPGAAIEVARLQVAAANAPEGYVPTHPVSASRRSAVGRLDIFADAWRGFLAAPVVGHGPGSFAADQRAARPDRAFAVAHAHDLILQVAYEAGLVGLAGLASLLVAFASGPWRPGRRDAAVLVGTVLALNLFDLSLWSAGVLLPLAAFAGWRGAAPDDGAGPHDEEG